MNEVTELQTMMGKLALALETGVEDLAKFEAGNMSAGTRVRKAMQDIKSLAQDVRVEVQAIKNNK